MIERCSHSLKAMQLAPGTLSPSLSPKESQLQHVAPKAGHTLQASSVLSALRSVLGVHGN